MFRKWKQIVWGMINDIKYSEAVSVAASLCNSQAFSEIKNCNYGKEVVLCGAGPSFNEYKEIDGALHVALNRAILNDKIKFDWFVADDWFGINFFQDYLRDYDCKKYFGIPIGSSSFRQIPESFCIQCKASRYYTDSYMVRDGFDSKFTVDIDKMAIGNMPNMALQAMQILLFTNPKTIYLVGCDASNGHFIQPEELDEKELKVQKDDFQVAISSDRVIQKWKELKEFATVFYPETKIVSINPVGLKGIFIDEYQK